MASMYFEGRAVLWYNSFSADHDDVSCPQFVEVLSARFEKLKTSQIVDDFNKLKLTGSYIEFVEKFEELKDCMKLIYGNVLNEEYYVSSFISGLTPELKSAVRMMRPATVQDAIDFGRDQMDTIEAITKRVKLFSRPFNNLGGGNNNRIPQSNSSPAVKPNIPARPQVKLLTSTEMAARRKKGLCFNCDEKFSPGHKCNNRLYLIMNEEEELNYL